MLTVIFASFKMILISENKLACFSGELQSQNNGGRKGPFEVTESSLLLKAGLASNLGLAAQVACPAELLIPSRTESPQLL